jgi:hypothetical protein
MVTSLEEVRGGDVSLSDGVKSSPLTVLVNGK